MDQLNNKTLLIDNVPYESRKLAAKTLEITQIESLQPKNGVISLENAPFNLPELPKVLQLKIFAEISPCSKNQLQKTCTFFHKNGSKQPPYVWNLINYPLNIAEKDLSEIVLKAVVYEKANILEKILQNHKKRNFVYEYLASIEQVRVRDFWDRYWRDEIVRKNLSFDIHQAAPTKTISDILTKYQCTMLENSSQKTNIKLTPLIIACFMQDEEMLINALYSHNNFSEREILTVLEHNGKINNQNINNILATKFPIAHTIYKQELMIRERDKFIVMLKEKCIELNTEKESLQKELSNIQQLLHDTKCDLNYVQRQHRIDSYSQPSHTYSPTYY